MRPTSTNPGPPIGCWIYFLVGPVVVAIAGIGGHFGERIGGGAGYWVGCYLSGIVAAILAGFLFARVLQGHPMYWAFGAIGMLAGGHLTWMAFGGRPHVAPADNSKQLVIAGAAIAGMLLGLLAAHLSFGRNVRSDENTGGPLTKGSQ